MLRQTPQKRVLFPRTLNPNRVGGFFAFWLKIFVPLFILSVTSVVSLLPGKAAAATSTNSTLNFQARLESATGAIVPDGLYNVQFKLYDGGTAGGPAGKGSANAGTNLWTETWYDSNGVTAGNDNRITIRNGYLSAILGSQTTFPTTINWDQNMWITMNIGGITQTATPTWDGEMNPRLALTGVPYAFRAGSLAAYNSAADLTSTLSIVQPTVGNQIFQIADQGAAGTYTVCVQGAAAANGGCAAATGGSGYIQNQIAGAQSTSNFWISGTGKADTSLLTPSLDSETVSALSIGGTSANAVTIGNTTNTATTSIIANTTLNLGNNSNNKTINLGATGAIANTTAVNIATSTAAVQTVTIGSTNGGSTTTLNAGTGNLNLVTNSASAGVYVKAQTDTATAFQVQASNSSPILNVDTTDTNLLAGVNAGFESSPLTSWVAKNGGSVARSTAQKYTGNASGQVTTPATAGAGIQVPYTFTASTTYTFSLYVRLSSGAMSTFALGRQDVSGTDIDCLAGQTLSNAGWTRFSCSFTTGATITSSNLYIRQTDAVARAGTIFLDSVQLEAGSNATAYGGGNLQLNATVVSPFSIRNSSDSTTAFTIQNATGATNLFNVDTLNSRVGIGTTAAGQRLDIQGGNINTSGNYMIGNANVLTNAALTFTAASANAIQGTSNQQLTVQSQGTGALILQSGSGTVSLGSSTSLTASGALTISAGGSNTALALNSNGTGAINIGINGQANTLQIGNTSGAVTQAINIGTNSTAASTNNVTIGSTIAGSVILRGSGITETITGSGSTLKTSTNSTTAFQIQNAASATLFSADTTNARVNVSQGNLAVTAFATPATPSTAAGSNQGGSLSGASGTTYYYKLSAINGVGESAASAEFSFPATSFTALTAPTAPTVAVNATAGNLTGSYLYKITFVTANGETTGGTTSASVSPSAQQVDLSAIPTGPTGTTARNIYRTLANGADGTQQLVAQIADNTTTVYTDNIADGSLGAALPGSNTARTNTNNLTVTFSAVNGASSYKLYRATAAGTEAGYLAVASSPFTDTGAALTGGAPLASSSNGRVGIGTIAPSYSLDVQGGDINTVGVYRIGGASVLSTAALQFTAGSANSITSTSGQNLTVSTGGAGALTLQSGSGTVSLGSSTVLTASGALTVRSTGANALALDTGSAAALNIGTGNANAITIGNTANTATTSIIANTTLNLGNNGNNKTINIGATGATANTTAVNIATSTGAQQTVTIGSTNASSTTTINGGNGITLNGSVIASNGINAKGYVTSNTGAGSSGQYTQLATCTLTAQFQDCRTQATIVTTADGGSSDHAIVDVRIKQQNAMAGVPYISLMLNDTTGITTSDLLTVTTQNDASATVVQLYGRVNATFRSWNMVPLINTGSVQWTWLSNQGYVVFASLPAGTQTAATYESIVTPTVTNAGNIDVSATGVNQINLNTNGSTRWSILSGGQLQSNGSQTIQSSTGNLTLASVGGNGSIVLTPNGTGAVNISAGDLQIGGTSVLTAGKLLQNILGYTQSSGSATFNQNAADQFKVVALQAPTSDMTLITNNGFPITTAGINAQQIDYYAALNTASAETASQRVNITNTSATASTITDGIRLVLTSNTATGATNAIKIDNITGGSGTETALNLGTGFDNLVTYNGTTLINGTGILQSAGVSGTYGNLTGTGALAGGSIASGFGTISTGNTITTTSTVTGGSFNLGASAIVTSGGVLQNVTADTGILTSGTLSTARGGTGVNGSAAANGTLLIGNGSGYSLATLTAGTGIAVTNAAGGITIASTGATGTAGGDLTGSYPNPTIAKLQGGTLTMGALAGGNFLTYNGSAWVNQSISGDITVSSAGVAAIGASKVTSAMILDGTIANADLSSGTYGNITGTGALAAGSIASGFGSINNGANSITTTGTITGGTVNATSAIQANGTTVITSGRLLQNVLGYTQSSGSATFNQNAADQFKVIALQAPTSDMVNISNSGFPITADAINGQQVDYYAALSTGTFQASAQRLNITNTSAVAGSITNGLRIVATGAVAGTTNGIKIDNFTSGTGGASALYLGTGWKDLLSYNGTQLISGTGILQSAGISGTYGNLTGTGALTTGSIAAGFGTIATGNTITGTTINGTTGINTGAGAGTQRIDVSGNLVNIGTIASGLINSQTISSAANFTGTVGVATSLTVPLLQNAGTLNISATGANAVQLNTNGSLRWSVLSTGELQGNGASTIQSSTGNLTLKSAGGNGNIVLTPNGTGAVNISAGDLQIGGTSVLSSGKLLQNILGYTQSSGNATFSQNAANQFKINALQAPTSDMSLITNNGFPITTAGINAQQIDYYAALNTASAETASQRINITNTSATASTITDGLRLVLTSNTATGATNAIKIDNITGGSGTETALNLGTGFDNLITYNGTQLMSGTGILQSAAISGSYANLSGVGTLTSGSISSFGTIATGNTISGTTITGTVGLQSPSLDTVAGALAIGGSNATSITLGKNAGSTNITTTVRGTAVFKDNTDGATAFQIQNAAGTAFFTADSANQILTTKDIIIGNPANVSLTMRLFSDGFETGDTSSWTSTGGAGTITNDTATVRSGKFSGKIATSANAAYAQTNVGLNTTLYGRTYFDTTTAGNPTVLMDFGTAAIGTGGHLYVYLGSSGFLCYNSTLNTTVSACSATAPSTSAWHKLEATVTISGTVGVLQVYLDGALVNSNANAINLSAQNFGTTPLSYFALGNAVTTTSTTYFDDVVVDTVATGDSSSLYVADSLHVSGNSTLQGITASGTTGSGYSIDAANGINSSGGFSVGGQGGLTSNCTGGQGLNNVSVSGGIITGGSCSNAATTLQNAYDFSRTTGSGGGTTSTPTLVQQAIGTSTNSTTVSATLPGASTAGNLLVAMVGTDNNSGSTAVVSGLTGGGTWYLAAIGTGNSGSAQHMEVWYCYNCGSATTVTATFSPTALQNTISVSEYSGVLAASDPLEAAAGGRGNTGPASAVETSPTITTANSNDLIYAGLSFHNSSITSVSTPTGFTDLTSITSLANKRSYEDYMVAATAGSYSATWNLTGGTVTGGGVATVAFKAGVTGGSGVTTYAQILLSDAKDFVVTAPDTATDPNVIINLQCRTGCDATHGRFAIQSNGTDALSVGYDSGVSATNVKLNSSVDLKLAANSVGNARSAITHDFTCTSTEAANDIVVVSSAGTVGRTTTAADAKVVGIVVAKPSTTTCTVAVGGVAQVTATGTVNPGELVQTSTTGGSARSVASSTAVGSVIGKALSSVSGGAIWVVLGGY